MRRFAGERHVPFLREKMTKDDFEPRNGSKCTEVSLLPRGLVRIARSRADACCEILDPGYLMVGQQELAHPGNIQPLV